MIGDSNTLGLGGNVFRKEQRAALPPYATQLLNAGCRITSIQRFLGHKRLNTTMIYARAHDQTVADDYFAAMERVEQRLNVLPASVAEPEPQAETNDEVVNVQQCSQLLTWVEILAQPELGQDERIAIVWQLKQALAGQFAQPALPLAVPVLEYASP